MLERFQHPAQVVVSGFAVVIAAGTLLLSLPQATESGDAAHWRDALFTATSAVCVTGLITVDTGSYWSSFGEVVILGLIQVGGLGLMTLATLFAILLSRRLGLRARMAAQLETKTMRMTDVRRVVRQVVVFSLVSEALIAAVLTVRLVLGYGEPVGRALYLGVFHAVSAFNNAGFALWPDNLVRFAADPWITLAICAAVIVGGLGFPVVFDLARNWRRPRVWTVLTRVTLGMTAVLLAGGMLILTAAEWDKPGDAGRSAHAGPLAGGLRVGGHAAHGRVQHQRQAMAIVLLSLGLVASVTFALLTLTSYSLDQVLFEVTSAFGTVGLSTGITADIPAGGQLLLIGLMFIGRIGPLTFATALALRERAQRYELPEERPIVG